MLTSEKHDIKNAMSYVRDNVLESPALSIHLLENVTTLADAVTEHILGSGSSDDLDGLKTCVKDAKGYLDGIESTLSDAQAAINELDNEICYAMSSLEDAINAIEEME